MASRLPMPNIGTLLGPMLPALPIAAVSSQPAIGVLPLLSPILRQRVQLLSTGSEPWITQLNYAPAKAQRLAQVVQSGRLEPHPVSNEVEVDWEYDAKTRYRRLDKETLQALVVLEELELTFRLVYCVGDQDGGGDGWRVGEVGVVEKPAFGEFGGFSTIADAEKAFEDGNAAAADDAEEQEDDDDDYWDSYNKTPSQSPANARSPAPPSFLANRSQSAEDKYYAQYDDVQPAMDNYDPDEVVPGMEDVQGRQPQETPALQPAVITASAASTSLAQPQPVKPPSPSYDEERVATLMHPRPASSASSNGSRTVELLEEAAERQGSQDHSIKQHVQRSIKSLYELSRASGMNRKEFERLVQTELDVFPMREGDDE